MLLKWFCNQYLLLRTLFSNDQNSPHWFILNEKYIGFFPSMLFHLSNICTPCHLNPFVPTVPTCAVRETASLGMMGAPRVLPLNPSETIVLWEHYRLRGLRGAPEVPPLCRETQSLGQQMLNAPLGINGLRWSYMFILYEKCENYWVRLEEAK